MVSIPAGETKRSLGERVFRDKGGSPGGKGRGEKTVAPHGAFPAMQSLKGEPRHYAVAVVHGPLPHHPFDFPPFPVAFFFLLSRSLSYPLAFSLSLFLSFLRPTSGARFCLSYFIREKASPPYIPTPTAYGTLSIRSRSNDTWLNVRQPHASLAGAAYRPLLTLLNLVDET